MSVYFDVAIDVFEVTEDECCQTLMFIFISYTEPVYSYIRFITQPLSILDIVVTFIGINQGKDASYFILIFLNIKSV